MMNWFSGIVLYAVVWSVVFLIGLQVGQDTQGDRGERVPGTHLSSPMEFRLGRRMAWATLIAFAIWGPLVWLIRSGLLTVEGLRALTGRPPLG